MRQTIISWLLALGALLITNVSAYAYVQLEDIDNYPDKNAVNALVGYGVINGYPDGTYRPYNDINRAEFTKILISAKFSQEEIDNCITGGFSDVSADDWFAPYVCVAKTNGIINGYLDGTFKPNNNISYAESLKIIYETYDDPGKENPADDTKWYAKYIEDAQENEILDENVSPNELINRGKGADVIYSFMDIKNKGVVAEERDIISDDFKPIDLNVDDSGEVVEIPFDRDKWETSFEIDVETYDLDTDYAFIYETSGIFDVWNVSINGYFIKPLCILYTRCFLIVEKEFLKGGTNTLLIEKEDPTTDDMWTLYSVKMIPFTQGGQVLNNVYEVDNNDDAAKFNFAIKGTPSLRYLVVGKARGIYLTEEDSDVECNIPGQINGVGLNDLSIICWGWSFGGYTESELPSYYQYGFFDGDVLVEGMNTIVFNVPAGLPRDITIEDLWIIPVE